MKKTLILGLGNPILGDDAVGLVVARKVFENMPTQNGFFLEEACLGGLNLLDLIVGYQRLILIDSIQTKNGKPGDWYRLGIDNFPASRNTSTHEMSFFEALEFGRKVGMSLPEEIKIYAVEIKAGVTFRESLTVELEKYLPEIIEAIVTGEKCTNGE